MWCSRGCLGPPAISDAWLCHVSIVGAPRRRGCAAAGVSVFLDGPEELLAEVDRALLVAGAPRPEREGRRAVVVGRGLGAARAVLAAPRLGGVEQGAAGAGASMGGGGGEVV